MIHVVLNMYHSINYIFQIFFISFAILRNVIKMILNIFWNFLTWTLTYNNAIHVLWDGVTIFGTNFNGVWVVIGQLGDFDH